MSAFKISSEDMAPVNEAAMNALVEAIAEVQQCAEEEACQFEAEEAEAARQAEEEAEARQITEEAAAAKCAEDKAEATRRADTDAMATSSFPEMDFPIATPEDLALPFSTLDASLVLTTIVILHTATAVKLLGDIQLQKYEATSIALLSILHTFTSYNFSVHFIVPSLHCSCYFTV
ncbi:hypothetical protein BDQ17DRAFT_1324461 [Cyathus striatus]|nr:hypothetical protein BDQ17DRAFT_1324461 [Cyathus striatus]